MTDSDVKLRDHDDMNPICARILGSLQARVTNLEGWQIKQNGTLDRLDSKQSDILAAVLRITKEDDKDIESSLRGEIKELRDELRKVVWGLLVNTLAITSGLLFFVLQHFVGAK